jgi:hypothetical protein
MGSTKKRLIERTLKHVAVKGPVSGSAAVWQVHREHLEALQLTSLNSRLEEIKAAQAAVKAATQPSVPSPTATSPSALAKGFAVAATHPVPAPSFPPALKPVKKKRSGVTLRKGMPSVTELLARMRALEETAGAPTQSSAAPLVIEASAAALISPRTPSASCEPFSQGDSPPKRRKLDDGNAAPGGTSACPVVVD